MSARQPRKRKRSCLRCCARARAFRGRRAPTRRSYSLSAAHAEGIGDVIGAIERHHRAQNDSGALVERRIQGQIEWGLRERVRWIGEEGLEREGGRIAVRARVETLVRSSLLP